MHQMMAQKITKLILKLNIKRVLSQESIYSNQRVTQVKLPRKEQMQETGVLLR
jgi:hypothetical protein